MEFNRYFYMRFFQYFEKLLIPKTILEGETEKLFKYKFLLLPPLLVLPLNCLNILRGILESQTRTADLISLFIVGITLCSILLYLRLVSNLKSAAVGSAIAYHGILMLRVWNTGGISSPLITFFIVLAVFSFYQIGKKSGILSIILAVSFISVMYSMGDRFNQNDYSLERTVLLVLTAIVGITSVIIAIIQNKTNALRIARDQAIESERIKTEFLSNMSHEIRTPLNGIIGMTESLKESSLDSEQEEVVGIINSSSEALLVIVNDILDLSKIQAGKLELFTEKIDLNELISSLGLLFKREILKKEIDYQVEIKSELPVYLYGDIVRLKQVIVNLLSNAFKFSNQKGKVELTFSYCFDSKELFFSIEDQGIGIRQEDQKKLFKSFSQADSSISRQFGGTGLGLSICSRLVTLMQGEISLKSEFGLGTQISCRIPLDTFEETRMVQVKSNPKKNDLERVAHREGKILVVEDNEVNQKVVQFALKKLGLSCEIANNGKEALQKLEVSEYSLILMDIMMPVMDGHTATREIKRIYGEMAPKIIALTANVLENEKNDCLNIGMCDVLTKPFKVDELRLMLDKHFPSWKNNTKKVS